MKDFDRERKKLHRQRVSNLEKFLLCVRDDGNRRVNDIITSFTRGIVRVKFLNKKKVRIISSNESKDFFLLKEEEIKSDESKSENIRELCGYLISKTREIS